VRGDAVIRAVVVLLGVFVLIGCVVNVADVFLVRVSLHADTTWYGVMGAVYSAGAVSGSLAAGRLHGAAAQARGFVLATVVLAVGLCGLGLAPALSIALAWAAVAGLGNGALNVTLAALVMARTAAAQRGRVAGVLTGVVSGTQLVAFAAGGALTGALGPRGVFVMSGALGAAAALLLGRSVTRAAHAREPAPEFLQPVSA
jgi:MFS family permease